MPPFCGGLVKYQCYDGQSTVQVDAEPGGCMHAQSLLVLRQRLVRQALKIHVDTVLQNDEKGRGRWRGVFREQSTEDGMSTAGKPRC